MNQKPPSTPVAYAPVTWNRQLLYAGKQVGTVAHLIVVAMPAGSAPGPGVGWRTLCGKRWADGARTHPDGWGFGRQGDAPLCRMCVRAHAQTDLASPQMTPSAPSESEGGAR